MALLKGADSWGHIIGNILGGKLYKEFENYYLNFGLACTISVLCIIYIICVIVESVEIEQQIEQDRSSFFNLTNVTQCLTTCFKDRPERTFVILLILNFAIYVFAIDTNKFDFLMTRNR